jgi:predicted transposase YbfD/YdcC
MAPFTAFVAVLADIEDPRRAEGKLYHLSHVVLFAILAMVAGANSYRTIHSFIEVHLVRLRDGFGLTWRKAPAYTTVRGILRQLDATSVEAAFRRHAAALNVTAEVEGRRHVAIDGKALRHSFDAFHDRRAAHRLSAFASDTALVLAHLNCDDKSNEIPAVQTLLGTLGLTGAMVTVDAMHCQKKAFEQAAAGGMHLIAQVKANQPTLHHSLAALCETAAPLDRARTVDQQRRCRDETRLVEVFALADHLAGTEWAGHLRAAVRVTRDVLTRSAATGMWRATSESVLFASDVVLPAATCAKAIRGHWSVENRSHYVRDGSFAEDASRIRCNPGILARLRSFAVNILRFNQVQNVTDARHRIAFGGLDAVLAMRVMN